MKNIPLVVIYFFVTGATKMPSSRWVCWTLWQSIIRNLTSTKFRSIFLLEEIEQQGFIYSSEEWRILIIDVILMPLGRSQLFPEIVENVLRSLFWAAGSKQPSPCLQPPKVGSLLRHLLLPLKAPLISLHFWSKIHMDFSQLWFRFSMNIFQWN